MKKKSLVLFLTGVMLASALAGCSSNSEEDSGTEKNSGEEKITLSFLRAGTSENVQKVYEELIEAYEKEHPNIKIEYEQVGFGE